MIYVIAFVCAAGVTAPTPPAHYQFSEAKACLATLLRTDMNTPTGCIVQCQPIDPIAIETPEQASPQ